MQMLLVVVAILFVVFVVFVMMQPDEFRVSRSATMAAAPEAIFPFVNDLHRWEPWSPWAKLDPNAKSAFDGPPEGVGAVMHWAGNNKVGKGSMTIIDSRPFEFIQFRLDFLKPMKGTSTAEFTFIPSGDNTLVTWSMFGENNFMAKVMSLVMSCDTMIGGQFEKGLASLNTTITGQQP